MRLRAALVCAGFVLIAACASRPAPPSEAALAKSNWVIAGAFCPAGCPAEILEFLQGFRGATVVIAPNAFEAPFVDSCDGAVTLDLRRVPVGDVVRSMNEARGPGVAVTRESLDISGDTVTSGVVNCRQGGLTLPLVRIVAAEPRRVLLLFEEQSVVELR